MIIQLEDSTGDIGVLRLCETDNKSLKIIYYGLSDDISIADIDGDDIFDTDEPKLRLQINALTECQIDNIVKEYKDTHNLLTIEHTLIDNILLKFKEQLLGEVN